MELIVELNASGKTIVLATHDLDTLDMLADRCIVFSEDHQVAAQGTPDRILGDHELLVDVNVIHDHRHAHRHVVHSHHHAAGHHDGDHERHP